jgi:CHAT domain-containing protein
LSACRTANGDKRAILGLAGIGLQSQVRSILASSWSADDELTADFMGLFYKALRDKEHPKTRAEALRSAQVEFIRKKQYPRYWASYVLIGNWK